MDFKQVWNFERDTIWSSAFLVTMAPTNKHLNRSALVSPTEDKLVIDVAMEDKMAMMVFAVFPTKKEKTFRKESTLKDIVQFAKPRQIQVKNFPNDSLSVFADSAELISALSGSGILEVTDFFFLMILKSSGHWRKSSIH